MVVTILRGLTVATPLIRPYASYKRRLGPFSLSRRTESRPLLLPVRLFTSCGGASLLVSLWPPHGPSRYWASRLVGSLTTTSLLMITTLWHFISRPNSRLRRGGTGMIAGRIGKNMEAYINTGPCLKDIKVFSDFSCQAVHDISG